MMAAQGSRFWIEAQAMTDPPPPTGEGYQNKPQAHANH